MNLRIVAVTLLVGASGAVCLGQGDPLPLAEDGQDAESWAKWGDPGDEFINFRTERGVALQGVSSLAIELRLAPETTYWPALRMELPQGLDRERDNFIELSLLAAQGNPAAPSVHLELLQEDRRLTRCVLREPEPGRWHTMRVSLRSLEPEAGATLRLAFERVPTDQASTSLFHVDGVRATMETDGYVDYTQLKDPCLDTPLARDGQPLAAIVAPEDGRHADAVAAVQAAVRRCAGCELPVLGDTSAPAELLAERSIIAIGNRHTSRTLDWLYYRYYTFLDARYPGPGGRVVRSLHDPLGTGHNVILVGGSDDAGVLAAAGRLAELLQPADPLRLGWLMDIELGEGMQPPDLGEQVFSWRDSFRLDERGKEVGYAPASTFGWNPISVRAALYHMTGKEKYLRDFVRLALPDPDNIPEEISSDYSFTRRADYDLAHPLVFNYHYHAHMVELLWDLIEESPLLDDETRLRITNELRDHQDFLDAEDDFAPATGASRHGLYDALSIYTGTRYFAKYYPAPRWQRRLDNMETTFAWWLQQPTWGEGDTLSWVNTSIEPVIEYFVLTGSDALAQSGMARTLMRALEILWTGRSSETSNQCQTISLMHKATHMLGDGRYAWLARHAGYDFERFRIGQPWWPDPDMEVAPPEDLVGRVSVMPLAGPDAERAGAPFEAERGYQFLSFRTGIGPDDGYLFVDGHNGRGRNPYHVSAIHQLRMGGMLLLHGYENQVVILRDGMAENVPPKASRLDATAAAGGLALVSTTVPNANYSAWRRDILWVDERYALVADTVTAREPGAYEVTCQWNPIRSGKVSEQDPRWVQRADSRTTVVCSEPVAIEMRGKTLRQTIRAELPAGGSASVINAIYWDGGAQTFDYRLEPLADSVAAVVGKERAVFGSGDFDAAGLSFRGAAALLSPERLAAFAATSLAAGQAVLHADEPISLVWDLAAGTATIEAGGDCAIALALADGAGPTVDGQPVQAQAADGLTRLRVPAGRHEVTALTPSASLAEALAIDAPTSEVAPPEVASGLDAHDWPERWRAELGAAVTRMSAAGPDAGGLLWAATDAPDLALIGPDGQVSGRVAVPEKLHAVEALEAPIGLGVAALTGGDDDVLRAFSSQGEVLWTAESRVSSDHKNPGGGYQAPWFTDPERKWGIFSLMVADLGAGPEIVLGRPSTVEFWTPAGELIARTAIEWGDCTELALLTSDDGPGVLAGKFVTGHDTVTAIGPDHRVIGHGFIGVPDGSLRMTQWMQRGITALQVTDLRGDGAQEVVVGRSGHWNDVRVYDAAGGPIWQRSFGQSNRGARLVRAVLVADLDCDDSSEIVAGLGNGWIIGFAADGAHLFSRKVPSAVTSGATVAGVAALGLEDGTVLQIGAAGEAVRAANVGSPVVSMAPARSAEPAVFVGTQDGGVVALPVEGH